MGLEPLEDLAVLEAGELVERIRKIELLGHMPLQLELLRQHPGLLRRLLPRRAPPVILQEPLLIHEPLPAKQVHQRVGDRAGQPRHPLRQQLGAHGEVVAFDLAHLDVLRLEHADAGRQIPRRLGVLGHLHEQRWRVPCRDAHCPVHALRDHDDDAAELDPGRERGDEVPARGRADADEREARELRVLLLGPPLDDGRGGGELAALPLVVQGPALRAAGHDDDGVPAGERGPNEAPLLGEARAARAARGGVEEVGGADGAPRRREQHGARLLGGRQLPQHLVPAVLLHARVEPDAGVQGGQMRRGGRSGAREEQRGGEEEQRAGGGDYRRGPAGRRDPGEDGAHPRV
jgi:hypothetical protein